MKTLPRLYTAITTMATPPGIGYGSCTRIGWGGGPVWFPVVVFETSQWASRVGEVEGAGSVSARPGGDLNVWSYLRGC